MSLEYFEICIRSYAPFWVLKMSSSTRTTLGGYVTTPVSTRMLHRFAALYWHEVSAVLTLNMHLFCLMLFCHTHAALMSSAGVSSAEVRRLLDEGLCNMNTVRRSSIMTVKALECLTKFLQIFDTICELWSLKQKSSFCNLANRGHICADADQQPTPDSLADPSVPLPMTFGLGYDISHTVTQAANNFLDQFSDNDFLSDGLFSWASTYS